MEEQKPKLTIDQLRESQYALSPDVESKLRISFRKDYTVEQACLEAKIHKSTYYHWLEKSDEFAAEMEREQNAVKLRSKEILADALEDPDTKIDVAKWLLSRREKKLYSARTELTGDEGAPLDGDKNELRDIANSLRKLTNDGTNTTGNNGASEGDSEETGEEVLQE